MNCKEEFLEHIEDREVLCAEIWHQEGFHREQKDITAWLSVNHCEEELESFLNVLDFTYDSGWGTQHLFGIIWYKDGTWSERCEYDGSEWWEHRRVPVVPNKLRNL